MDEQSPPPPLITPRRITFGDSHSDEIDAVAKRRRLGRPPEIRVELLDRDATGNLVPARGERLGAPGRSPRATLVRARVLVDGADRGSIAGTFIDRRDLGGASLHAIIHGELSPALPYVGRALFKASGKIRDPSLAASPTATHGGAWLHLERLDFGRYAGEVAAEAVAQLLRLLPRLGVATYVARADAGADDSSADSDVVPTRGDDALPLARVGFARLESEKLHDVLYATPELLRSDADRLPAARVDVDALLRADDLAELARDAAPAGLDAELRRELLHADVLLRLAPTLDAADERAASAALARVVEEIEARVAAGASVDGACLLHVAVEKRVLPLVPLLVDVHGADVNRFDANGLTPLMCAAHRLGFAATSLEDTLAVCGLLVARGADAGLADGCGLTALGHFYQRSALVDDDRALLGERRRGVHLELAALLLPRGGPTPADERARLAASGVDVADVVARLGEVPGDFEARDGAGVACACGALATGTHFVARGGGAAPLGPAGGAAFGPGYRDLDFASVVRAPAPPPGTVVSVDCMAFRLGAARERENAF